MTMFRRYIALIALVIISLGGSQHAASQVNTDQVMRIGINAMSFDDYILAIQYFNQVIQAKPYLARPYYMRAVAKYNLEDFAGAEEDASKALEINPFITDIFRLRGASRQNMGKYQESIDDYDKALSETPDDESLLFNKSLALAGLKRYNDADTLFGTLISQHPNHDIAYLGRANVRLMMGDTINAIPWLDKGIEINPDEINAYLMRYNIALNHEKDKPKALNALDKVIQLSPKNTDLYIARANLRYNTDDYFGAMADYSYALELDPDNDMALFNRALLRTEVMDFDNALNDYEKILATDPDNDLAIYNHAMILAQKGDYKRAIEGITHFIDLYPTLSTGYFVRSQWLLESGNQSKAKADYDKGRDLADYHRPVKRHSRKKSKLEKKYEEQQSQREHEDEQDEELTPEEFEKRLTSVIEVDNDTHFDVQYDNASIRGKIQNRNFNAEIEPMMLLSYYATPSELQRKTYYIKDIDDLNATHVLRKVVTVTTQPGSLTESDLRDHFSSIDYFNSTLSSREPRAADFIGRALDFMTLKNYESAISDLDKAIALTPDYQVAYMLRAQARDGVDDENMPRATQLRLILADLDKAIELSPRNAVAWYNKGNVLFEMGDFTSAILAYTKAIEYQPDMGEAYFNRGYANLKLGNSANGKADLSKAGELGIVPAYNLIKRITRN